MTAILPLRDVLFDVLKIQEKLKELGIDPYKLPIDLDMIEQAILSISSERLSGIKRTRAVLPDGIISRYTYRTHYEDVPEIVREMIAEIEINNRNTTFCERNFGAVKEMMHILDAESERVTDREEIASLSDSIIINRDSNITNIFFAKGTRSEYLAILKTIELLFPWACRDEMCDDYESGEIDLHSLSEHPRVPKYITRFAMQRPYIEMIKRESQNLQES